MNPLWFKSKLWYVISAKYVWSRSRRLMSLAYKRCTEERPSILWLAWWFIINGRGFTSCGWQWASAQLHTAKAGPAAPRGWKPIPNNKAFIFNELLHNNIWARDLARPAHLFFFYIKQQWLHQHQLAHPSSSPCRIKTRRAFPTCFVESGPETGISLARPPPSYLPPFFSLLMMLKSGIILYSR